MDLQGKRILITGASGGLGRAMARQLHQAGARLILSGRRAQALQQLAGELGGAEILLADWSTAAGRQALADCVAAPAAAVDAVILNAGVNAFGSCTEQSSADFEQVLQTDLLAPALLARAMLAPLQQRPAAALLFVGSTFARLGHPGFAAYCAAKHGLHGLAKALRRECHGTPLRILEVHPRAMATAMSTPEIDAVNRLQGAHVDAPERIASEVVRSLRRDRAHWQAGWPERLFVLLDQRLPGLLDRVLGGRWPQLRDAARLTRSLPAANPPPAATAALPPTH